jgi:hypothetical protein
LSRFLRDYLYILLGGNQRGAHRTYVNLLLTMLLGGIWHGAAWTFLLGRSPRRDAGRCTGCGERRLSARVSWCGHGWAAG